MTVHPYEESPDSYDGYCHCGLVEESRVHPHVYVQAYRGDMCACGAPVNHNIHMADTTAAWSDSVLRGTDAARDAVRRARGHEAEPVQPIRFV